MRYMELQFTFVAEEPVTFPENPVNTFRGALGYQLKHLACIKRLNRDLKGSCKDCEFGDECVYSLCFETNQRHLPEWFKNMGSDLPNLLIIEACFKGGKTFDRGESFDFLIRLFGKAINSVGHLILAAQRAGSKGLTKDRVPCHMKSIVEPNSNELVWAHDKDHLKIPSPSLFEIAHPNLTKLDRAKIKLSFITPVAFKDRKTGQISKKPDFSRLIGSLMRRYSIFEASEGKKLDWNFGEIAALARDVELLDLKVQPAYWERYSTKQRKRIPISGFIGEATYEGPVKPFVELLNAGSLIRCGRSVAFGQGKIKAELLEEK